MSATEHECLYPEVREGNWFRIAPCEVCGTLPPYEWMMERMRRGGPREST